MRAAINNEYGTPDVLRLGEVARPLVGRRQVLVEVHASSVTEGDRRLRSADFPGFLSSLGRLATGLGSPRHPVGGSTFAGRVVEVGPDVSHLQPGDDVFGTTMHGAYAEYMAVSVDGAIGKMPRGVSYAEAAAIPYGAGTALHFLRDMAAVQPGERVLIIGASGGVGRMAVQVAKHLGAHVTGVCSTEPELVRALGADEVIDYRHEDFRTREQAWDVIFDTTQGDHFRSVVANLTRTGRYLSLYVTSRALWEMAVTKLFGGPRALVGVALGGPQQSEALRVLVEQGAIRATVARCYPLSEIVQAHRYLEQSHPHGSVVIEVIPAARMRRVA